MTIKILSMLLLGVSLVTTSATSYVVGYGAIGGGLGYFPADKTWSLSAEYDSRRGITGFKF